MILFKFPNAILITLFGIVLILSIPSALFNSSLFPFSKALAQPELAPTKYRNLVIDLGNGISTNAQLSYPAIGNGSYPGVLLIAGIGPIGMNAIPLALVSEYLSERGYAVLKYDKRGVGPNSTVIDTNVWENATFHDLKRDAEVALDVLINQPEVDPKRVSLIGHSEGTMIASRIAIDNPTKVENVVIMGAVAQNLVNGLMYFQLVGSPLNYAEEILDKNNTGEISIQTLAEDDFLSRRLLESASNDTAINIQEWIRLFDNQVNASDKINIQSQLVPVLVEAFNNFTFVNDSSSECLIGGGLCRNLIESHRDLPPTLDIIENISPWINILILNGQNDSQTTVRQALALKQKLDASGHPNHELITYPDLGHFFYPSPIEISEAGPIQPYVLRDLYEWLESKSR